MNPDVRKAVVAGQFYPGGCDDLERAVRSLIGSGPARKAKGIMVPHAGYIYSGAVAGDVYGLVAMPDVFVIVGPNHTGMGAAASVMTEGVWRLPCGDALVDENLAQSILDRSDVLKSDREAHAFEHSIEVQLPFLQALKEEVSFVPVTMMTADPDECRDIGMAISGAILAETRSVLIIASSDMSHYESQAAAQEKDNLALDRVLNLDPEGLIDTVIFRQISMCGVAPGATMLYACKEMRASRARLVRYATSGDVNGDYDRVVGYAGVIVS